MFDIDQDDLPGWLSEAVLEVFFAAVDRDPERAGQAMRRIGELGPAACYAACAGWASLACQCAGYDQMASNEQAIIGSEGPVDEDDPNLWAARFVTCHANQDRDMQMALFLAGMARGDEWLSRASVALVGMAGDLGRQQRRTRAARAN